MLRTVAQMCSVKNVFLEISQNSQKTAVPEFLFLKKKETLAQVFSSEFWEVSKNTFYYRTSPVAVSKYVFLHN